MTMTRPPDRTTRVASRTIAVDAGITKFVDHGDVECAVGDRQRRQRRGLDVHECAGACGRRFDSRAFLGGWIDDERPSVQSGDERDLGGERWIAAADEHHRAAGLGTHHRERGLVRRRTAAEQLHDSPKTRMI